MDVYNPFLEKHWSLSQRDFSGRWIERLSEAYVLYRVRCLVLDLRVWNLAAKLFHAILEAYNSQASDDPRMMAKIQRREEAQNSRAR
ncbi:unnamed protein product [Brassica napus]|uniref:(rape) hypothetical protein n=1 Tax=Brassica napus TaxID=3708 RepID=A0A816YEU4_BRANA|nr:unnamed protein product [Brassica napus]